MIVQQTLTKSILKNAMRQNLGFSDGEAEAVYISIIRTLTRMFQENDSVKILDFGTFAIRHKEPRKGRNPKTNEEVMISARRSIRFRPARQLRSMVEGEVDNEG